MSRAVFSFSDLGDGHVLRLEEIASNLPDGMRSQELVDLDGLVASGAALDAAGSGLFTFLAGIAATHHQLAALRQDGCALMIEDESPDAQGLPWETLRDGGQFLALGTSPLLCRSVTPKKQLSPLVRPLAPPLKILAVLAATGGPQPGSQRLTAIKELEALVEGLDSDPGVPYELHVLGCDHDLVVPGEPVPTEAEKLASDVAFWIDRQNAGGGNGNRARLSYEALESVEQIGDRIGTLQPQVVHFFCHGFAGGNVKPRLELARRPDQLARLPRGSLLLEAPDLADLLHGDIWLVVLNCCLGAAASESISFARELMSRPGRDLPATVAMREAIDRRDAHLFCKSFYDELTGSLSAALAALPQELVWAKTMPPVRKTLARARCGVLSEAHRCSEWTLPVLYVRRETFQLVDPAAALPGGTVLPAPGPVVVPGPDQPELDADEILGQLNRLKTIRDELAELGELPAGKLEELDAKLNELRRQLLEATT